MNHIGKILPILCDQTIDNFRMTADSELIVSAVLWDVDFLCPLLVFGATVLFCGVAAFGGKYMLPRLPLFLLPRFFALENIFYVEPISDLIGPVVSMIVYWTSIQKILKQREEAVRLMHTKKA